MKAAQAMLMRDGLGPDHGERGEFFDLLLGDLLAFAISSAHARAAATGSLKFGMARATGWSCPWRTAMNVSMMCLRTACAFAVRENMQTRRACSSLR